MNNTKSIHVEQEITQIIHAKSVDQKFYGGKRGRPSLLAPVTKPKTNKAIPVPTPEIRFNSFGYLPDFVDKQGRCRHCPKDFTSIQCVKCKIRLCNTKVRNCFYNYHMPS